MDVAALALGLALALAPPGARRPAASTAQPSRLPTVVANPLFDLSTATGPVTATWPSIAYDREHDELYVVSDGYVRIFDGNGMETYRFGDDGSLGVVRRVAVLPDGDIIVLAMQGDRPAFLRCNYRGELIAPFALTGLPEGFGSFAPDTVRYLDGTLYFAERGTMRVVLTDVMGAYREWVDLRGAVTAALGGDSERKAPGMMDAFNVDGQGNMLFTMAILFSAGTLSPGGEVHLFGTRGSTPGRFNIVGGIDADTDGNLFVTDRLRSVVQVWDKALHFLGEFGYRGEGESNLIVPYEIAVGNGKVFVAQARKMGVRVFRVALVPPPEPGASRPGAPGSRAPEPAGPPRPRETAGATR